MSARPHETPMFETEITRLFGIRHPILCGGLMWLATAPYVAAVAKAGGLGFISAKTFPDPDAFRNEIRTCRDAADGNPFGVNLYVSAQAEANAFLEGHVRILLDEGVRIVETAGNAPGPILPILKKAGCKVIHKASILRHAERAVRDGADAVTIVGMECGGHPGMDFIGSMVQAPLVASALPVPVVVGGGIGTGRQLVGALAMGAAGVLMGTRMLVSQEIWADAAYKERVVAADERASRLVLQTMRNTYRIMDNESAQAIADLEAAGVTDFEKYRPHVAGELQRKTYESGDTRYGLLSLGQAAVFADRVAPVADIFDDLLTDAKRAVARVDGCVIEAATEV